MGSPALTTFARRECEDMTICEKLTGGINGYQVNRQETRTRKSHGFESLSQDGRTQQQVHVTLSRILPPTGTVMRTTRQACRPVGEEISHFHAPASFSMPSEAPSLVEKK